MKHTNLIEEIYKGEKPQDDITNNIIVGIAVIVTIAFCGLIFIIMTIIS